MLQPDNINMGTEQWETKEIMDSWITTSAGQNGYRCSGNIEDRGTISVAMNACACACACACVCMCLHIYDHAFPLIIIV